MFVHTLSSPVPPGIYVQHTTVCVQEHVHACHAEFLNATLSASIKVF